MKNVKLLGKVGGVVLALLTMLSADSYGQVPRRPSHGYERNRNAMAEAITAPVSRVDHRKHDKDLDGLYPLVDGREETRGVKPRQLVKNRNKAAKREMRMNRRDSRLKLKKDRMAMGPNMTARKNADPRKVRKVHR